jgi:rRNA maturation endonuclease Nob1
LKLPLIQEISKEKSVKILNKLERKSSSKMASIKLEKHESAKPSLDTRKNSQMSDADIDALQLMLQRAQEKQAKKKPF